MSEHTGIYYSENTALKDIALLDPALFNKGISLYEVLRVQDNCCLFLEDHLQRLQESVHLSGFSYTVDLSRFRVLLGNLISKNRLHQGNIKLVLHFTPPDSHDVYAYFIPHAYPAPSMYAEGVDTALFRASRSNPNVKRLVPEIREKINHILLANNLYEVLLVNNNSITEGSRSNVFFVQGDRVITPPGDLVLKGITRHKVISLCNTLNFKLFEKTVSPRQLREMDAVFLTGTSPKILGIRKIGSLAFSVSNPIIHSLSEAYDGLIAAYIQLHSIGS
ncbi:MAG: aminotransferase class IV [Bacteroidales bacterium]|nr:aminotransferase class IV [Bacteroidales bacterium]